MAVITSPDYPGERLIACRNATLADERRRKREVLLAATETDLSQIRDATRRKLAPLHGEAAIGLAVGAVINKHKMAKHFDLAITASRFDFRRSEASIAREAALDGIYVIRTGVSADVMIETEAVSAYKDLSRVERAFRTLKSVDLAFCPVHHGLSPWVRAHVFLYMMAYYVEWHLRDAQKALLFQDQDRPGAEAEHGAAGLSDQGDQLGIGWQ